MGKNLLVVDLVAALLALPPDAKVQLVDQNGLHWAMEPDMLQLDACGDVVIGDRNIAKHPRFLEKVSE